MTEKEMRALEVRYVEACNKEPVLLNMGILYLLGQKLPVMGKSMERKFYRDVVPYCRAVLSQKSYNNEESQ